MSLNLSLFGIPFNLSLHVDTKNYAAAIAANGGTISNSDLLVINSFVKGCYTNNIRSKILGCNLFAGENLSSALTMLWSSNGTYCINNGFSSSDYSKFNGIVGNGSGYLDSTISLSSLSNTNAGLTIFNKTDTPLTSAEIGALDSSGYGCTLYSKWSDNFTYFTSFDDNSVSGYNLSTVTGVFTGVVNGNSVKIYRNQSEVASFSSVARALPTLNIYVFGRNNIYGFRQSARMLGAFAIHQLSFTEVLIFNQLLSDCMTALGR